MATHLHAPVGFADGEDDIAPFCDECQLQNCVQIDVPKQADAHEFENLKSQFVTSKPGNPPLQAKSCPTAY
jgi:hypothetical protein